MSSRSRDSFTTLSVEELDQAVAEAKDRAARLPAWSLRRYLLSKRAVELAKRRQKLLLAQQEPWRRPLPITRWGLDGPEGGMVLKHTWHETIMGTTAQLCGLWPASFGGGSPILGAPLGQHLIHGKPVFFDALEYFRNGLITSPTVAIIGLNGYGKSSLTRRLVTYSIAAGRVPLILGDCKPDFRSLIELMGGQIIEMGPGRGCLNPLDPGSLHDIVAMLKDFPDQQRKVEEERLSQQASSVKMLLEIVREGQPVADYENAVIRQAIDELMAREEFADKPPILEDLFTILSHPTEKMCTAAVCKNTADFAELTITLRRSVRSLIDGSLGPIVNGQTTTRIDVDSIGVCIDVSAISENDTQMRAAVLMLSWTNGFAAVNANHILADCGLVKPKVFELFCDELWQVFSASPNAVDLLDRQSRLNRTTGSTLTAITHTLSDFTQVSDSESRNQKARGFIERCRAKFVGPINQNEIEMMRGIINFTEPEEHMLTTWSSHVQITDDFRRDENRVPAGMGCFVLKLSESGVTPGIPFHLMIPPSEFATGIHNTSKRLQSS